MLADAPVIEDRDLFPQVGVPLIGHPVRVLAVGEPAGGVRPIAERLHRRAAAAAQGQLGRQQQLLAKRAPHRSCVGDQVRAVLRGRDGRRQAVLELRELGDPAGALPRRGLAAGEILQGRDGLEQAGRGGRPELRPQPGGG